MSVGVHTIRDLRAGEVSVIERVFAGLSTQSRYRRFHAATPRLTATMKATLAAVDGQRVVALVALDHCGGPLGLARLVTVGPGCGELSIEVVDAAHRQGIGAALLRAAMARAAALGLRTVSGSVLAGNRPMLRLLERSGFGFAMAFDGPGTVSVRSPVPAG